MLSAIVERARKLVGCAFRPQGRNPRLGLDCVGLACAAFRIPIEEVPSDYRLRGAREERLRVYLDRFFRPVRRSQPGDLLLLRVAADQLHLAVLSDRGFIHADASLRKVVETPGAPPWPIVSIHRRRRKMNEK